MSSPRIFKDLAAPRRVDAGPRRWTAAAAALRRRPPQPRRAAGAAGAAPARRGGRARPRHRAESVPRHHRVSGDRPRRRRVRRLRPAARHQRRRRTRCASTRPPTRTCRSGTRRRSATTARRCCSPTSGAAAAQPRCRDDRQARVGRRTRSSRIENRQAEVQELLQAAGAADVARELRRAQRLADSDPGPRRHGAGVVSGRHLGVRLDRRRRSRTRSPTSIAARSTRRGW